MTTENRTRPDAIADYLPLSPRGCPRLAAGCAKSRLALKGDYVVFQLHISATPKRKFKVPRRHFQLQTGHFGADIIS